MPAPQQSSYVFVSENASGRDRAGDAARIRSHCMRGKNKRTDSRRSLREFRRRTARDAALEGHVNRPDTKSPTVQVSQERSLGQVAHRKHDGRLATEPGSWARPRAFSHDLSLANFAEKLGDRSSGLLFKVLSYDTVQSDMWPIDRCVAFNKDELGLFMWLYHDHAYLHSVLHIAFAVDDLIQHRQPAVETRFHLQQTIVLLNAELSKNTGSLGMSNVYIIMALALTAGAFGDHATADVHFSGLQQLLRLQHSKAGNELNPKTLFKIDQIELFRWLNTGAVPPKTRSPATARPSNASPSARNRLLVDNLVDPAIAAVYQDFQQLVASLTALNLRQYQRCDGVLFQQSMHSIQTRLLHLATFTLDVSGLDEILVIGMLVFLSTAFRLPAAWSVRYAHAAGRLRRLLDVDQTFSQAEAALRAWCIMAGAISVLDAEEAWVRRAWRSVVANAGEPWEMAKRRLASVMWIDCVHDEIGLRAYRVLATPA